MAEKILPVAENDELVVKPLGAGQEVGRSCHILTFKGKKIMLDCGIHPGYSGMQSLPFIDLIEPSEIDILLINHCGALPWFLTKTAFKGRCFMTPPTKAIYQYLLADYVKVSNIGIVQENQLYTEADIISSLSKIETINFHQVVEHKGVRFWCYHAGHVLGAAMFMVEIAGVKVLYTGDFSRMEDRHLMCAETPTIRPEVLIVESTYGVHVHERREDRESRFTNLVYDIINRGGRCLIPVFALGRAQELLLILDEYWSEHPELQEFPIYYASQLAKKCMSVYQTFGNAMNERVRRQITVNNPFHFKHISNLKNMGDFEDSGPCVVLASPGMMQNGLSRELFETWCTDQRNGVIIAGYCVEGTMAKHILTEPEEVATMGGAKLPLKCSVNYISFSAHTDYKQTSEFVRDLKPPHVILVHGEQNEMQRLRYALEREYEDAPANERITLYTPRNTQDVRLYFQGEKLAKVVGELSKMTVEDGGVLSGILVKKNFNYRIMADEDISKYTDLMTCHMQQRQSISYTGTYDLLRYYLQQLAGNVHEMTVPGGKAGVRVFNAITVAHDPGVMVTLEWSSNPINDMYAEAILAAVLRAENDPLPFKEIPPAINVDSNHFIECLLETLSEMFGPDNVGRLVKGDKLTVTVDNSVATINLKSLMVTCPENLMLEQTIQTTVKNLHLAIAPLEGYRVR